MTNLVNYTFFSLFAFRESQQQKVTLVQQDEGVLDLHLFQGLNEFTGHSPNVGSACAFDLGDIVETTHTEAVKFSIQRSGNRFGDRCLAHA